MIRWCVSVLIVACGAVAPGAARAQNPAGPPGTPAAPGTLTIDQAIQYANEHYPSLKAAFEQVTASSAGVDVARTAYLPRLEAIWQSNRATANNVFGQVLPQSVIPALSGPVLPSASGESVFGSATGALLSWEPVDFGLRRAGVAGAEAAVDRARAGEALTRLDLENAVASAFLGLLAAERAVVAGEADVDRRTVLRQSVQTLVDNQLRPGADASRADAERAASQTRLSQAQQSLVLAQSTLTRLLGVTTGGVTINGDSLLTRLPAGELAATPAAAHPLVLVRDAAVEQARAAEGVLARTDLPRLYLQSSVFARGSGAKTTGPFDPGVDGLGLERVNWAAGVQVIVPNVFDLTSLRARKTAAAASTRAEVALHDEAVLTVTSQQHTAEALLNTARAIAANTAIQRAAAQQSENQARARYDAGLAGIVDVADAQDLLAQADVQDQLAHVDVWRALLAVAVARGDLSSFLTVVRQP